MYRWWAWWCLVFWLLECLFGPIWCLTGNFVAEHDTTNTARCTWDHTHTPTHVPTHARTHGRTHSTRTQIFLSLSAYKFLCVDIYIYSMYDWYNIYIICIYIICTRNPLISCLYLSTPLPPCHPWYLGWSINPDVWGSLNGVINDHQAANGLVVV